MGVTEQIKTQIARVEKHQSLKCELLIDIMNYIASINTIDIVKNLPDIAYLFCGALRKTNDEKKLEEITESVSKAFESIQNLDKEKKYPDCSDIKVIQFLHEIYYKNVETNETILSNEDLKKNLYDLAENLERIKVIFKLKLNDVFLFKIGALLKDIIMEWSPNSSFEFTKKQVVVIFLAVQVFRFDVDKESNEHIVGIIREYNLQFLKYLIKPNVYLLGGLRTWIDNFKNNGVLVAIDDTKILIRSEDIDYFNQDCEKEYNKDKEPIAYFKEIPFDSSYTLTNAQEILEQNNDSKVRSLLKIMMNGYVNIFIDNSLLIKDNEIIPVNQYSNKDKFCIINDINLETSKEFRVFEKCFSPYGLRKIIGNGLDCVTLRTFLMLQKIQKVSYDRLFTEDLLNSKNIQNKFIMNWLKNIPNPLSGWYKLKEEYFKELSYVENTVNYLSKSFTNLGLYPIKLDCDGIKEYLLQHLLGDTYENGEMVIAKVVNDFFDGTSLELADSKKISIDDIESGEDILSNRIYNSGQQIYIWCDRNNKYYVNANFENLIKTIDDSRSSNTRLIPMDFLKEINERDVEKIISLMRLHEDALMETCNNSGYRVSFEHISCFRIAQQLCYFQIVDKNKYEKYIGLLNRHEKMDFDFLLKQKGMFFEKGTLYVPKEKKDCSGTLRYIYENILRSDIRRYRDDELYCEKLGRNKEGYFTIHGEKIKKIVFLFDTLQRGTATKRALSYYFERKNNKDNTAQKYYDSTKKEVFIEDIIKCNDICKENIILNFFYSTVEGQISVREYCDEKNKGHECLNEIKITKNNEIGVYAKVTSDDIVIIRELFGEGSYIYEGSYMIVRKFNSPKQNIFPEAVLNPENIVSIFNKKDENK